MARPTDLNPEDRLIVALDRPSISDAEAIVDAVGANAGTYKIGYQLMPIGGFEMAQRLREAGRKVFLDLKLHDIGATVERGVASVCMLGADFLTVHAEPDVLAGAVAGRGDDPRLRILAVTVLTSLDAAALARMGLNTSVEDLVLARAEMAVEAGVDGVIASGAESTAIRTRFGDALEIVTPGIRPVGASLDDQKRVMTPRDALSAGADRIVVGRPIVANADPAMAASAIVDAMR